MDHPEMYRIASRKHLLELGCTQEQVERLIKAQELRRQSKVIRQQLQQQAEEAEAPGNGRRSRMRRQLNRL
jgi:hypothetical protein